MNIKKAPYLLCPILFFIYPILYFYSRNAYELRFSEIISYILVLSISATVFTLLFFLITKSIYKAVIFTVLCSLILNFYGIIYNIVSGRILADVKHYQLLPICLFAVFSIIFFASLIKNEDLFKIVATILSIFSFILFLYNGGIIAIAEINKYNVSNRNVDNFIKSEGMPNFDISEYPDIYYIILDECASFATMKDIYNYDSSWFKRDLEKMGFFVAEDTKVKSASTTIAIPSYLNMGYINDELNFSERMYLLDNNKTFEYLKNKGYTIAAIDTFNLGYPNKGTIKCDIDLLKGQKEYIATSVKDFYEDMSIMSALLMFKVDGATNFFANRGDTILKSFETLASKETISIKSPKMVYTYIMSPHTPFMFDQNGNRVLNNWMNFSDKKYYREQYIFAIKQIKQCIDNILTISENPPIILLQSDHGPRPKTYAPDFDMPDEHMYKILNAYYFPDNDYSILEKDTDPVDSFKIVFNKYFNMDFNSVEFEGESRSEE